MALALCRGIMLRRARLRAVGATVCAVRSRSAHSGGERLVGDGSPAAGRERLPSIDTTVPHSARFWDYSLGGKDNYPVDREIGEQVK
jgi:S-adenosyl methyltransferase